MFFIRNIWTKYAKSVIVPAIVIAIATTYFILQKDEPSNSNEALLLTSATEQQSPAANENPNSNSTTEHEIEEPAPEVIIVDVKGAVNYPGVYSLTTENRIVDAIEAAGGYTLNADPKLINHAQKLVDELVIYVPQVGEELDIAPVSVISGSVSSSSGGGSNSGLVNLNTATEADLTTLPGIGPSKAAAIIAYREENGQFATIDDLKKVSGIGDKTFERLKDLIAAK